MHKIDLKAKFSVFDRVYLSGGCSDFISTNNAPVVGVKNKQKIWFVSILAYQSIGFNLPVKIEPQIELYLREATLISKPCLSSARTGYNSI